MKELTTFLLANWYLSALFLGLVVAIIVVEIKSGQASGTSIQPDRLTQLINKEGALVFDCRDKESFQAGHVTGAVHLSEDDLAAQLKKYKKHQDKPCVVIDADGRQFAKLVASIKTLGFQQVVGLSGGISAWKQAGLPLVKGGA